VDILLQVNRLFDIVKKIDKSHGVVYAIKLPTSLEHVKEEYGMLHLEKSILRESIIGKVILPKDISIDEQEVKRLKEKSIIKFHQPGKLGNMLNNSYMN